MDQDLERILANDPLSWVTISCIYEDVMDPEHVVELLDPEHGGKELSHGADELKHHLLHAEREIVEVFEVKRGEWTETDREAAEVGIREWMSHKHGKELDCMTLDPWLDGQHRRYWVARWRGKVCTVSLLFFWLTNLYLIFRDRSSPSALKFLLQQVQRRGES